jgi:hypothetical protein
MENFSIDPHEKISLGRFQEVAGMPWKKGKKGE